MTRSFLGRSGPGFLERKQVVAKQRRVSIVPGGPLQDPPLRGGGIAGSIHA